MDAPRPLGPAGTPRADPRVIGAPGSARGITGARLLPQLLLGCALMLPFGSAPLASWAQALPERLAPVAALATAWHARMQALGLTRPYDAVHAAMRHLVEVRVSPG